MKPSRREALAKVTADGGTHAGLWFDAMLASLPEKKKGDADERDSEDSSLYRDHLVALTVRGVPDGYRDAVKAREQALRDWPGSCVSSVTRVFKATCLGRMVVGLGIASLVETNLALHRTWGVPYIPGSALKGLATSTAHRSGDADWARPVADAPGSAHSRLMSGDTSSAGVVTFHDAWWVPEGETTLPIDLDVMTVHHAKYYMEGEVPADWDAPNPVAFVTAHGSYQVVLSGPADWVEIAAKWLELGLERDGVGAKTHAGYGRMSLVKKKSEQEEAEERAAQAATQAERSLLQLIAQYERGRRGEVLTGLLTASDRGVTKIAFDAARRELFEKDRDAWKAWLKDPKRTDAERALFTDLGTPAPVVSAPAPVAKIATPAADVPWVAARAWIGDDPNGRKVLYASVAGKRLDRNLKDVPSCEGATREALVAATMDSPLDVEVQLKGKDKILAVRRV